MMRRLFKLYCYSSVVSAAVTAVLVVAVVVTVVAPQHASAFSTNTHPTTTIRRTLQQQQPFTAITTKPIQQNPFNCRNRQQQRPSCSNGIQKLARTTISESLSHRTTTTKRSSSSTTTALYYGELRGVDTQLIFDTWEWTAGLGAPAALVAGAVLATMYDSREEMSPRVSDKPWIRIAKKACRFLLLSAFGLEVISIFVTTVTGTMLLGHGDTLGKVANMKYNSPLGFLRANWEYEYLTARIAFLLGLFHWLASVALELLIPKRSEGVAARRMNQFTASALCTILVGMISFANRHMGPHYTNCIHMLRHYFFVCFYHYFWPLQPLAVVMIPMVITTMYLGIRAFTSPIRLDQEEEEKDNDEQSSSSATA